MNLSITTRLAALMFSLATSFVVIQSVATIGHPAEKGGAVLAQSATTTESEVR